MNQNDESQFDYSKEFTPEKLKNLTTKELESKIKEIKDANDYIATQHGTNSYQKDEFEKETEIYGTALNYIYEILEERQGRSR